MRVRDKHYRYDNYSVAQAGEIAIFLPAGSCLKRHGILSRTRQLTIPSFAFSSFRKSAF